MIFYLKLLLTGLYKLPPITVTVYRGVKLDLAMHYPQGRDVVWWGFSSATANVQVLENPEFLGVDGKRTMFAISCREAVDIERYSALGHEKERLLLPGTCFEVEGTLNAGNGLVIVQLQQNTDEPSLVAGMGFGPQITMVDPAFRASQHDCSLSFLFHCL